MKKRAKLSKAGAPRLRKALYFPAIAAIKLNPYIKEPSARLRRRGKCPMQIIGAAMRRLVHLAYGVLQSGRPFDPKLKNLLTSKTVSNAGMHPHPHTSCMSGR